MRLAFPCSPSCPRSGRAVPGRKWCAAARRRRGGLVVRGRPKVGRRELRCGPSRVLRARGLDSPFPAAPAGGRLHRNREARAMRVDIDEPEIIERVAALDVAKAEVVCCARVPGPGRQRMQEVRTVSTMTAALLELGDWLAELGVTRVVMEATSDYWRPPFYLLEGRFETWLVNAHDVKHLPGRPKTDRLDAVWLCKVAERQMLRPSFVPPAPFRELRDLTRYRVDLIAARTAEKQRVEKLLEDAMIKVSVIVSDVFGVSGRAMLAALIAGERDPAVLASLARGTLRSKVG